MARCPVVVITVRSQEVKHLWSWNSVGVDVTLKEVLITLSQSLQGTPPQGRLETSKQEDKNSCFKLVVWLKHKNLKSKTENKTPV